MSGEARDSRWAVSVDPSRWTEHGEPEHKRTRTATVRHRPDYLAVVESAYCIEVSEQRWLADLLARLRPLLDRGLGAFAWFFHRPALEACVETPLLDGCSERIRQGLHAHSAAVSPQSWFDLATASPCASWSECVSHPTSDEARAFALHGIGDLLHVRALDSSFTGCVFSAPAPEATCLHPRQVALLSHVAAHIAAAYRLRRRLSTESEESAPVEAVLERGALLHAEGHAKQRRHRDLLLDAARAREHSRRRLRQHDPERAVQLWRALVAGRWSLVDRVDRDGRRFLLARRNPPGTIDFLALTTRERQVAALLALGHSQKLLAYELGLASATVSETARSALRKLGVASRSELLRLYRRETGPVQVPKDGRPK
jgi:DNA-binding CsgD family transcriptional regulator